MEADSLGKKIRRLRINNCLSQARLAEAVDVSTNYIGQIERGDRTPSLDTVIALCNALHASVDYVVSDDISTRDDEIMTDIRAQLVKLTPDEKQYFYPYFALCFSSFLPCHQCISYGKDITKPSPETKDLPRSIQ